MPWADRTGPLGQGPLTGRGAGYCAGYSVPGYMNPVGRGGIWGRCRGGGRGWRNWYYATGLPGWARGRGGVFPYGSGIASYADVSSDEKINILKQQAKFLEERLNAVNQQLKNLQEGREKNNE